MQSNSDCENADDDEVPVPPKYIPSHAKRNKAPFHIHPYDTHLRRKVSGSASQPDTGQQVVSSADYQVVICKAQS